MLGDLLAANLNKKPGDTLEIQGSPFTVCAIYHGGSPLEAGAVILPLDQMQRLSSLQGKVSTIHVRLRPAPLGEAPDHYLKRAQAQIEAALPGLRAVPAAERASNNQFVRLAHASAWGTSCIALLIGILGIANTMAMSVFERTREIGILRALAGGAGRYWFSFSLRRWCLAWVGDSWHRGGIGRAAIAGVLAGNGQYCYYGDTVAAAGRGAGHCCSGRLIAGAIPAWARR